MNEVEWLQGNGTGFHTLSWARDRLGKAFGREYTFDEVRTLLREAGIEPKDLTKGLDRKDAEEEACEKRRAASGCRAGRR